MKGLRKYISPFAPDQSGAAAVLCELGGLVVILDAGGCAGNICGFDEPRWFGSKSAIFSAGLRDMDAILGRDDKLVEKIEKACEKIRGNFVAVIGTPVPAVIGTDYAALRRMIEKKTGLPVITIDTNGMDLYDEGVKKATLEIIQTFAGKKKRKENTNGCAEGAETVSGKEEESKGSLGVLGATPLDIVEPEGGVNLIQYYKEQGWRQAFCYGMGSGLSEIALAGSVQKNVVAAPAGLAAAKYMAKEYGIPYETAYPLKTLPKWDEISAALRKKDWKKILIVHQQVLANTLREEIRIWSSAEIHAASWFLMERELKETGDLQIKEEDQWQSLVMEGGYDLIIGDPLFRRAAPDYKGEYLELTHFAVSGKRKP